MESLMSIFYKPDPAVQRKKISIELTRSTTTLKTLIQKLETYNKRDKEEIKKLMKKPKRDDHEIRRLARQVANIDRAIARQHTGIAQINSIRLQTEQVLSMRKIGASLESSVVIMKALNSLRQLEGVNEQTQKLGEELVKAGIIEDMTIDMLPLENETETDGPISETELDAVIRSAVTGKSLKNILKQQPARSVPLPAEEEIEQVGLALRDEVGEQADLGPTEEVLENDDMVPEEEKREHDNGAPTEAELQDARGRYEALKA